MSSLNSSSVIRLLTELGDASASGQAASCAADGVRAFVEDGLNVSAQLVARAEAGFRVDGLLDRARDIHDVVGREDAKVRRNDVRHRAKLADELRAVRRGDALCVGELEERANDARWNVHRGDRCGLRHIGQHNVRRLVVVVERHRASQMGGRIASHRQDLDAVGVRCPLRQAEAGAKYCALACVAASSPIRRADSFNFMGQYATKSFLVNKIRTLVTPWTRCRLMSLQRKKTPLL